MPSGSAMCAGPRGHLLHMGAAAYAACRLYLCLLNAPGGSPCAGTWPTFSAEKSSDRRIIRDPVRRYCRLQNCDMRHFCPFASDTVDFPSAIPCAHPPAAPVNRITAVHRQPPTGPPRAGGSPEPLSRHSVRPFIGGCLRDLLHLQVLPASSCRR